MGGNWFTNKVVILHDNWSNLNWEEKVVKSVLVGGMCKKELSTIRPIVKTNCYVLHIAVLHQCESGNIPECDPTHFWQNA